MVSLKAWLSLGEKDGEVLLGRSARGVPSPLRGSGTHWLSEAEQGDFYGAEEGLQSLMDQAPAVGLWKPVWSGG